MSDRSFGSRPPLAAAVAFLASILAGSILARAAAPSLEHLRPIGLPRGITNAAVRFVGKAEPWPPQVWTSAPGIRFLAETNAGVFRVDVATNAPAGAHLVRFFNADGASEPRVLVVGSGNEISDAEPNDRFASPQGLSNLPVTVTGRLDRNGDVDSFAIRLRAGQWLDAALDAYVLMSKLDPVLRLVTTNGVPLAWNHDYAVLDPRLRWRADADRTVVLQVSAFRYPGEASIQLAGGDHAEYRLHVVVSDAPPHDTAGFAPEAEPNDTPDRAPSVTLPLAVHGVLDPDRDVDRFQFLVASNVPLPTLEFRVEAAAVGSPLDAWLRVTDAAGKELAYVDDNEGNRDPRLEWKAPGPGAFQIVVGSLTRHSGPAHRYRLLGRVAPPDVEARTETAGLSVTPGTTNEWKFKASRLRGFTNELAVELPELPAGIVATPTRLSSSDNDVTLKLAVATNAPAASAPIRILLATTNAADGARFERPVTFFLTSRGENNGVPQGWSKLLADRTDRLWLAVLPPPPPPAPRTNAPAK